MEGRVGATGVGNGGANGGAEIEAEHIHLGPKIGDGSFGTVYKASPPFALASEGN
jgi:hypothetical protein